VDDMILTSLTTTTSKYNCILEPLC